MTGNQTFVSIDGTNLSGFFLQINGTPGKFDFIRWTSDSTSSTGVYASSGVTAEMCIRDRGQRRRTLLRNAKPRISVRLRRCVGAGAHCQTLTDWSWSVEGKMVEALGGPPHSEAPATVSVAIRYMESVSNGQVWPAAVAWASVY